MLNQLTEQFARHVDALENRKSRRRPPRIAAAQNRNVGIAYRVEAFYAALCNAVAVVTQNNARTLSRHQCGDAQFEPAIGQRRGEQHMAFAELAFFTHVEQRKLLAVVQHVFEIAGGDGLSGHRDVSRERIRRRL